MELESYPNNDLVLKWVRELIPGKENIWVSVQLPAKSTTIWASYIYKTEKKITIRSPRELCSHADDVADGVVLTLDSERCGIHDLCVPLIRHSER